LQAPVKRLNDFFEKNFIFLKIFFWGEHICSFLRHIIYIIYYVRAREREKRTRANLIRHLHAFFKLFSFAPLEKGEVFNKLRCFIIVFIIIP
jgi:hypothetical protein